jgi:hypothetical protein
LLDADRGGHTGASEPLFGSQQHSAKAVAVRTAVVVRNAVQGAFKLAFARTVTMDALVAFMKTTRHALQCVNPAGASKGPPSSLRLCTNAQTAINSALYVLSKCDTVLKLPHWPTETVCYVGSVAKLKLQKWMYLAPQAVRRGCPPRLAGFLYTRLVGASGGSALVGRAVKAVKFARRRAAAASGGGSAASGGGYAASAADLPVTMHDLLVKEPLQSFIGPGWRRRVLSGGVQSAMTEGGDADADVDADADADVDADVYSEAWRVMVVEACELSGTHVDEISLAALALVLHVGIQHGLEPAPKVPVAVLPRQRAVRHCALCGCSDDGGDGGDASSDDSDDSDGAAVKTVPVIHMFSCADCTHGVCTDCRVEVLYGASRRALGLDPAVNSDVDGVPAGYTRCPVPGCGGTAPLAAPCPYMVLPPTVAAVAALQAGKGPLPPGATSRDDALRCAVCGTWVLAPAAEDGPVATCAMCTMKTCARCGLEAHCGVVCPTALPITPTELLSLVKAQPCPGCKLTTTKSGSCNHMHCPVCGMHWCWICGQATGRLQTHYFDAGNVDDEPVPAAAVAPPVPKCSMFAYTLAVECQRIRDALGKYLEVPTHRDAAQQALALLQTTYSQDAADL